MADVLVRLAGPASLGTSASTVYTAPGGTTATITAIHVANESSDAATFSLSVGTDAPGNRFYSDVSVAAGAAFDWAGTLVLDTAEVVQASASAASSLTLTMSGVETT